jgi:glycosyltransferase involved in cell wall biosynthesis
MNICFLAGGNSIHSYRWITYFADKRNEISWVSLSPLSEGSTIPEIDFYEIRSFSKKIFSILKAVFKIRRLIKETRPEILHAHYAGTYGLIGALSGFHPFILTPWGSDVLIAGKSEIKKWFVKYILKRADLITCDAEHMRNAITKFGVDFEKIHIIYFGIDTQKFFPGRRSEGLAKKLEVFDSSVIVSLRSLEPVYDIETLIRSVPHVVREIPDAKFIIVGTGSQEKALKGLSKSLGVSERIRFVGKIPNEDISQYLGIADIYVSTSLSDAGIAASTAEAMACGLPVVITDSGENRKWIKDGEGGFLIPVRDASSLGEKIIYLLHNKELRMRFGKTNRRVIEQKNNYYKEMEKMSRIYEAIIRNE